MTDILNDQNNTQQPQSLPILGLISTFSGGDFLKLALKYWYIIVIAILLVIFTTQMLRIKGLKTDINEKNVEISLLKADNDQYKKKNEELNQSIINIAEKTDGLQKSITESVTFIIENRMKKNDAAIRQILSQKPPENCSEAVQLLRNTDKLTKGD